MDVLINKEIKNYHRISRYSLFPIYYHRLDEKYLHGITAHLQTSDTTYVNHKVALGDTLDTLALHYYNNPTYYWIIADFNRIQDPFEPLQQGDIIKVPTFSNIQYDI